MSRFEAFRAVGRRLAERHVSRRRARHHAARPVRLALEPLEDRRLLAVFSADPTAADGEEGSLRALISAANATPEADTIHLLAGDYHLTLAGDDDNNAAGDLDITGDLTLIGPESGDEAARIVGFGRDAAFHDRVFDIHGATVTMRELEITGGHAMGDGGGIRHLGNYLSLVNVTVTENVADARGGGIYNRTRDISTAFGTTISNNSASYGGGVFNHGSWFLLDVSRVSYNSANYGGGIFDETYQEGTAGWGASVTVQQTTVDHNRALEGGGIWTSSNSLAVIQSRIWANRAEPNPDDAPPGFDYNGPLLGGGIFVTGSTVTVIRESTIDDNTAGDPSLFRRERGPNTYTVPRLHELPDLSDAPERISRGGGIAVFGAFFSDIINSTISGNSADDLGGGIYIRGGPIGQWSLKHVTVANNMASDGRAIYSTAYSGHASVIENPDFGTAFVPLVLQNTIVNGRDLKPRPAWDRVFVIRDTNIRGYIGSWGNNLIDQTPSDEGYRLVASPGVTDIFDAEALLSQLLDFGGFVPTHALLPESPAIDNGNAESSLTIDQRGVARPQGAAPDIGAVEQLEIDYGNAPGTGIPIIPLSSTTYSAIRSVWRPDDVDLEGHYRLYEARYDSATDPARHAVLDGGPVLGERVDGDLFNRLSTPSNGLFGDYVDLNATEEEVIDEDGILSPLVFTPGQSTTITVSTITGGVLNAWFDFNGDGDWDDPGEHFAVDVDLVAGNNELAIAVPADAKIGPTFARFHISSEGGLDHYGFAVDGEVEDYAATIVAPNEPPVAVADAFFYHVGNELDGDVTANDSDAEIDPLTVHVVDAPQHGTLELSEDGQFTYTPEAGFVGVDSFTYFLSDGEDVSETVTVALKSQAYRFLEGLYADLLGREASAAEIDYWLETLRDGPPDEVVRAFQQSPEFRGRVVDATYDALLSRSPEPEGRELSIKQLADGQTVEDLWLMTLASDEYFALHGGNATGFVEALYADLLGRGFDELGRAFWVEQLQNGATRERIVRDILASAEFNQLLIEHPLGSGALTAVGELFRRFVEPDAVEANADFADAWFRRGQVFTQIQDRPIFVEAGAR